MGLFRSLKELGGAMFDAVEDVVCAPFDVFEDDDEERERQRAKQEETDE